MKSAGILLAAGYSRRLGQDKSFVKYKGFNLIDLAIKNFLLSNLNKHIVIAGLNNYDYIHTKYPKINVILNSNNTGQNSSIKLGIEVIKDYDFAMFMAIDQPFLKLSTINKVISSYKKNHIIVSSYNGNNGLPTIFDKIYFDELLQIVGDKGGKDVIKKYLDKVIFVNGLDEIENFDIDTQEDLEILRRNCEIK